MQNAELAQLEELAEAGTWRWQVGADTLHWSPELSRIYGLSPGEAPQGYEGFLRRVHPDDRDHTMYSVQRAISERRDVEYRHRIVRADGQVRVLRSFVRVHSDERGEVICLFGQCQDVTERVEMQERARRLQALASAGLVAAGLSHDLNNMVGALCLLCGSLARNGNDREAELIGTIRQVAGRASAIAQRIHQLAGTRRGSDRIDLGAQVRCVAGRLREILPQHISLDVDVRVNAGVVALDELDLERVLLNLAINARDAQPDGGSIEIVVDRIAVVADGHAGDYYRISLRDEGMGMNEVTAARLFEPFFTTKSEGNGIGLAVVHDIVDGAGGFVTVDSRRGAGTRVRIHLPPAG